MNQQHRRLGLVLAVTIAVLAVAITALPSIQPGSSEELDGPTLVPRPIVTAVLLGLPAVLAAIAALRGSRAMFVAAGVLCLVQSIVAFSGVTLGFLIPGMVLVSLGLRPAPTDPPSPPSRREWYAALFVVGLGIAAWVVPIASAETVCWIARQGPDGDPVYTRIPVTNTLTSGVGDIGSGCNGGVFTLEGLLAGGALAIGALATAGVATSRRRDAAAIG